ncbi:MULTISPECIES: MotA/TolQ/ExbB proton channel family protein [Providencia]|uniref:MotA/TolQ/ExbB proton channel domain-containing protein n=3 Tax=Providencia rettgeri TaxID=587 RepID=A0AAP2JW36_PRORE|nr:MULTISPECIES: MotA/TolQ/ExbB proton channel family protein [Providencia]ELR5134718.1 MotA/TolQ/ExbB proton channel family protein [Providencia rettgeri]ELR5138605.1 MotA/TolQ/ExbB proton channel family protein [Providencia rettgeri]ELR5169737.1 MotA/TolQ/ExbB proton channel family protein [Providencia rettgeri]ELR5201122.1 MotA/TolQ/ExbB proton channel family protein [Providencia rettgeri]MBQ0438593.1 MotA/TolQ/ExbB proton channel family protein [Providencia rettgeri]
MTKINKMTALIVIVNAVFVAFMVYISDFIFEAISHNVAINITISILLAGSAFFCVFSSLKINRIYSYWNKCVQSNKELDDNEAKHIFGERFKTIIKMQGKKQEELITTWTEYTDWKARILEYLAGTLIGLGLLGTFIGLMGTMGSISGVLGAATGDSGNAMVEAISTPLGSMSGAFSASLMGLLSSLFVGLISLLIDRQNSEFVESIKTWLYTRKEALLSDPVLYAKNSDVAALSQQALNEGIKKLNAFCDQTKDFILQLETKIDNFNLKVAKSFDVMVDEIKQLQSVNNSVGKLGDVLIESNQSVKNELSGVVKHILESNHELVSARDTLRQEIAMNRQQLIEVSQSSNSSMDKLINEALSNRNEILKLNKLSTTLEGQLERYQLSLSKDLLSLNNLLYDNGNMTAEINKTMKNLDENSLYNKGNIDKILSIQGINHDISIYALEEIIKTKNTVVNSLSVSDK